MYDLASSSGENQMARRVLCCGAVTTGSADAMRDRLRATGGSIPLPPYAGHYFTVSN